jgi:hypothetical protein
MKNTYWIADADGTRAVVEGADARDSWVRVHGWTEATEPDRQDFVWVRHEDPALGAARMTWEAAQLDAWAGRGWTPGAPPEPAGATKDPVLVAQAEPAKTRNPAAGGDSKEKVNG